MCHGVAGEFVPALAECKQFIPTDAVARIGGGLVRFQSREIAGSYFRVRLVQHPVRLLGIITLVVEFSCSGVVIQRSLIAYKTDGRRAFEEVVLIRWNAGRLFDNGFQRTANERPVILGARNVSGDDKESGGEPERVHDRNRYAELIDGPVV